MGKGRVKPSLANKTQLESFGRQHEISHEDDGAYTELLNSLGHDGLMECYPEPSDDIPVPMDSLLMEYEHESNTIDAPPSNIVDAAYEQAVMAHVLGDSSAILAWQDAFHEDDEDEDGDGNLKEHEVKHESPEKLARRRRRVEKAIKDAEDDRLDDELSDWHIDEDEYLATSHAMAMEKYEEEVKKLQERKWKDVSLHLEQIIGQRKYTAKACKERFAANESGTALLPIELDPDQEGRRELREERTAAARARRAEVNESSKKKTAQNKRSSAQIKRERVDKKRRNLLEKYKRDAYKAQMTRIRQERADALAKKKEARLAAREHYRLNIEWERAKKYAERSIYKRLTGRYLLGLRPMRNHDVKDESASEIEYFTDPEADLADAKDADGPTNDDAVDAAEEMATDQGHREKAVTRVRKMAITKATLLNPRSVMSMDELEILLHERGLPRRTPREQHAQVVARMAYEDDQLSSNKLSELLRRYFDKSKGSKTVKAGRLQELDAKNSANGRKGIAAMDPEFMRGYEGYAGEFRYMLDGLASGESGDAT